jgi:hypothetical protein
MQSVSNNIQTSPIFFANQLPHDHELVKNLKDYLNSKSPEELDTYFDACYNDCTGCKNEIKPSDYSDATLVLTKSSQILHKTCLQRVNQDKQRTTTDCQNVQRDISLTHEMDAWNKMQPTIHTLFKDRIDALNQSTSAPKNPIKNKRKHENLNPPQQQELSKEVVTLRIQDEGNKQEDDTVANNAKKIRPEEVEDIASDPATAINKNQFPNVDSKKEKSAEYPAEKERIIKPIVYHEALQALKLFHEKQLYIFPADKTECLKMVNEFAKTKTEKDLPKLVPITRWSSTFQGQICSTLLVRNDNTLQYIINQQSSVPSNPVAYAQRTISIMDPLITTFTKAFYTEINAENYLPEPLKVVKKHITNSIAHRDVLEALKIFEENGLYIFPADRTQCLEMVNEYAKNQTDLPQSLEITRMSASFPCQICSTTLTFDDTKREYISGESSLIHNASLYARNYIVKAHQASKSILEEFNKKYIARDHLPEPLKSALILKEKGITLYQHTSEENRDKLVSALILDLFFKRPLPKEVFFLSIDPTNAIQCDKIVPADQGSTIKLIEGELLTVTDSFKPTEDSVYL